MTKRTVRFSPALRDTAFRVHRGVQAPPVRESTTEPAAVRVHAPLRRSGKATARFGQALASASGEARGTRQIRWRALPYRTACASLTGITTARCFRRSAPHHPRRPQLPLSPAAVTLMPNPSLEPTVAGLRPSPAAQLERWLDHTFGVLPGFLWVADSLVGGHRYRQEAPWTAPICIDSCLA
jgi:hypothetical protein